MDQVQIEYWEMGILKINEFNFLNKEVEKFTSRWSQNLVNVRSPSYFKQRNFEYCLWGINRLYIWLSIFIYASSFWCMIS